MLANVPDREIVLGLTGRFWWPTGGLVRLRPSELAAFHEPGYAQAVWSYQIFPVGHGCALTTETRVRSTDDAARRALRRYWRVVGPFSGLIRRRALAAVAADAERATD